MKKYIFALPEPNQAPVFSYPHEITDSLLFQQFCSILKTTRRTPIAPTRSASARLSRYQQASMANSKLYVGGIPYRSTEDDLRTAFEEAGAVTSASIITDRMTGRSRGFGFVEMASEAEAQAAIDRWDGKELDGRMLSVSMARPQGDRPPREGGFGGGNRGGGFGGGNRGGFGGGDRGGYQGGY